MAIKLTTGKQNRAQKVVIYGAEGIGKSTLASNFPGPVFLDVEGGTAQLDVARVDGIVNWPTLVNIVREFASEDIGKTLVVDTADWAEKMCIDHICKKYKKNGIEEFGYGKGYTYLQEEFNSILDAANECIKNGKNVVFLAHAKLRKFEQPDEMGAYDRWGMKLTKQVEPILKEWADMLLFLNYQTTVVTSTDNKKKAMGGKRVIYTSHHPCWDAKNRHGLPEEMPLQWEGPLAAIFTGQVPEALQQAQAVLGGTVEAAKNEKMSNAEVVIELATRSNFNEDDVLQVLKSAGMCEDSLTMVEQVSDDTLEKVIKNWEEFKTYIIPFK